MLRTIVLWFHHRQGGWKISFLFLLGLQLKQAKGFASWGLAKPPASRWRGTCAVTSQLAVPSTTVAADEVVTTTVDDHAISGLLPHKEFNRLNRIDEVLRNLQSQLDNVLTKPLSDDAAKTFYEHDFELLGPSREVLAASRDELVALSTTLVVATSATRQASRFVSSLGRVNNNDDVASSRSAGGGADSSIRFDYQFITENTTNLTHIGVLWKTNVASVATAALETMPTATLEGTSLVELNPVTGKIRSHQLLNVKFNDQPLNGIGETLASMRATVRSFVPAPWLSSAIASSSTANSPLAMLTELRRSMTGQAATPSTATVSSPTSDSVPLFVTKSLDLLWNDTSAFDKSHRWNLTKADDLTPDSLSNILPGTNHWKQYASSHKILTTFVNETIPKLSSIGVNTYRKDFRNMFTTEAKMFGIDNQTLLMDGDTRISDFYRTLSRLRRKIKSSWTLNDAHVEDWMNNRVRIHYVATIPNPFGGGDSSSITEIEGTDIFVLQDDGSGRIERVEQSKLVAAGHIVTDPSWYQGFIAAVEAARAGGGDLIGSGADWWMDMYYKASGSPLTKSRDSPPALKEKTAATVYKIMAGLHGQIASLESRGKSVVPVADFLTDNVELRGYLGEVLIRGKPAYLQAMGIALASLNGAIASGRVKWVKPPRAKSVELTAQGTVKCSMILPLQIKSWNENIGLPAVPLDLELVSEYEIDDATGYVTSHRLVESRVNGQWTPLDVMPRWIKQWASNTPWKVMPVDGSGPGTKEATVQSFISALSTWVQSRGKEHNGLKNIDGANGTSPKRE